MYGKNFMQLCMDNKVTLNAVEDYVEYWHENTLNIPLHEFLGMTDDEYVTWMVHADALPWIIQCRKNKEEEQC